MVAEWRNSTVVEKIYRLVKIWKLSPFSCLISEWPIHPADHNTANSFYKIQQVTILFFYLDCSMIARFSLFQSYLRCPWHFRRQVQRLITHMHSHCSTPYTFLYSDVHVAAAVVVFLNFHCLWCRDAIWPKTTTTTTTTTRLIWTVKVTWLLIKQ